MFFLNYGFVYKRDQFLLICTILMKFATSGYESEDKLKHISALICDK